MSLDGFSSRMANRLPVSISGFLRTATGTGTSIGTQASPRSMMGRLTQTATLVSPCLKPVMAWNFICLPILQGSSRCRFILSASTPVTALKRISAPSHSARRARPSRDLSRRRMEPGLAVHRSMHGELTGRDGPIPSRIPAATIRWTLARGNGRS